MRKTRVVRKRIGESIFPVFKKMFGDENTGFPVCLTFFPICIFCLSLCSKVQPLLNMQAKLLVSQIRLLPVVLEFCVHTNLLGSKLRYAAALLLYLPQG